MKGYFYLTTPKAEMISGKNHLYSREIQFNADHVVGFKRTLDDKLALREVYEVKSHRLYRFITYDTINIYYLEDRPERLIDVRSDVPNTYFDSLIVHNPAGNKEIHRFQTHQLMIRDRQHRPKRLQCTTTIPFYLSHLPAFQKHFRGYPVEMTEESGLGSALTHYTMTYFTQDVNEAAFDMHTNGYRLVTREYFNRVIDRIASDMTAFTDISEEDVVAWKENFTTLFIF
ncbi:MAG: hypothetical protein IPN29_19890 [Saprospiraceae bacterium]|nr:hypothetical protein [Saprospiraceae bacterium]